jgi:septum formation protein
MKKIILASASPRRRELLRQLGLTFEILPSNVDEDIKEGEDPRRHVLRLARSKAEEVAKSRSNCIVIGADTIVVLDDEILGKPKDEEEACAMLSRLSGREHLVFTGFCVIVPPNGVAYCDAVDTRVRFKHLSAEEIRGYVRTGETVDKAGAYAVQGKGSYMIKEIQGSYTNVVGLPLCELVDVLARLKAIKLFPEEKALIRET